MTPKSLMTHFATTSLTAIALLTLPVAAVAAPAELTGTVTDRFDDSLVIETTTGRILVEVEGRADSAATVGARVIVNGDLQGQTLRDATLTVDAQAAPLEAPAAVPATRPAPPADQAQADAPGGRPMPPQGDAPGARPMPPQGDAPGARPMPPQGDAPGARPMPPADQAQGDAPGARPAPGAVATDLPPLLAGLALTDVRDETNRDGEREIRALLPDGARFEVDYDRAGEIEEMKTEPRAALPQPLLDAVLSGPVRDRIATFEVDHIHEVEIDDDGSIEIKGAAGMERVEIEVAANGDLIDFERSRDDRRAGGEGGRRGPGDDRAFDMPRPEIERIAAEAGYTDIERVESRGRHADVWATNANDEPVRIRIDMSGDVTREERR